MENIYFYSLKFNFVYLHQLKAKKQISKKIRYILYITLSIILYYKQQCLILCYLIYNVLFLYEYFEHNVCSSIKLYNI